jgi:gliding motility-associated-like protein
MKSSLLFIVFGFLLSNGLKAQLAITPSNNGLQLSSALTGSGLSVIGTPILNCPTDAAGTFSNGLNSDIGIATGVILTTGSVLDVTGGSGNDATIFLSNTNGGPTLPDLDPLTNDITEDGCMLTFQVKPICNTLSINYVFASEEYSDFVNSSYNDVFGFFVSGPNPLGGNYANRNIALVPGTNTPVTINTINNGNAPSGTVPTGPGTNAQYFNDNTNGQLNPYDGMTKMLVASISVTPCEIYTIKLEIADVGDGAYDSGVLLEANSVSCPINLVASAAPHKICVGQSTTLNANVAGGTGTYSWSTGATGPSISVSPSSNTVYTSYYTFCGVTVTDTVNVQINPIAGATFQYPSNAYCKGGSNPTPINVANGNTFNSSPAGLVFANNSTGVIDIALSNSGTYTISLPGSGACPAPAQQVITIQNAPTASISGNTNICSGDSASVQISFVGTAPFSYTLNGPSGNQTYTTSSNPQNVSVGAVGSYTISTLSDAGCPGSTSGLATVGLKPKPSATFSGGANYCQGTSPQPIILNLSGTSPFEISFTENGNPVTQVVNSNTYTYSPSGSVSLIFTSISDATTCSDVLNQSYNITQNPQPAATILGGGSVCFGLTPPPVTLNLTGNGPWTVNYTIAGLPYSVNVTNSPFNLTNNLPGDYLVTSISDINGCLGSGTGTANITLFPGVTSSVNSINETICPGETATIIGSGGVTASWSPVPSISSVNNYTLQTSPAVTTNYTLTVDDGNGCKDTSVVTVRVAPIPQANFTFNEVCFGNQTNFTNTSSISAGSLINTYSWNFNNLGNNNSQNPTFNFPNCGNFNVSLKVISSDGCEDSISIPVKVNCIPLPTFLIDDTVACENQTVYFTNTSVAPVGSTSNWSFGSGQGVGQNTNESNAYPTFGNYIVSLILTSPEGCKDSVSKSLTVIESPEANFTSNKVCLGALTNFNDNSVSNNSTIIGYSWIFDLNLPTATSTIQNPTHTYSVPQIYNAQLIVTDANNCSDTLVKQVEVTPIPNADFTFNNVCLGIPSNFQNSSSISDNTGLTYQWDYETNSTIDATSFNTSHTYTQSGNFNVTLYCISNNNCRDSVVKVVSVYDYPTVNFIADTLAGCEPLPVNFTNATVVSNPSSISQFSWYINNVYVSSVQNVSYNFGPGFYSIKLIAKSNFGCVDSLTKFNYIESYPKPTANFDFKPKDASVLNPIVSFMDISLGNISQWYWDFGDTLGGKLITDSPQYPEFQYADSGNYNVGLLVISDKGCVDSVFKIIRINPEFIVYVPNAFTPNGDDFNGLFFPKGIGVNETKDYQFYIYDRWGNEIYKTTNWKDGWNGKFNNTGKLCMGDLYIYKIYLVDVFGRKHQYYGHVNLIR